MVIIIITLLFCFIYLLYPLWLRRQKKDSFNEPQIKEIDNVSIIYLSQNYAEGLAGKISFLLEEISGIANSELIVIDDASSDESVKILQCFSHPKFKFISKANPRGIPHSMNLGVKMTTYQNICFCDQRQMLEKGIIKKLIAPLRFDEVGMVSSCVSNYDKSKKYYLLRAHENNIKELEGQTGSLMGVYGPLYALKRECYHEIPGNTILDDLYLTLRILNNKKVVFQSDCKIHDDNFDLLYSYKRAKRYLAGFIQILNEKNLIRNLSKKQKIMLFWHKYFRIPMPLLIVCCYVYLGILGIERFHYDTSLFIILMVSILCMLLLLTFNLTIFRHLKSVVRFVGFYSVASIELFVKAFIFKKNIYEE